MAEHVNLEALAGKQWSCTGESSFSVADLSGQWTVLYFYPKDATPGCTTQGCDFRDRYPDFTVLDAQVFGVSRDSIASHERFKAKQDFPFALISDPDETLCRAFDVIKEKTLFGKKGFGIERSTFLLNSQGQVVRAWRKVKVAGHVDAVAEALKLAQQGG
ncbi:peroxiredoxin [Suttonella sp. R2A3]|uniref:peroxiredoxin n=1 Tax=Suttonella sp. R2A3 TaxID=2908648 RepID=UPI001F1705F6|nr:peroxiredoxin [Suttonella sp. R2A3]UJF25054.1 peroxiredoxin [Suttonella sp. R2A3]